MKLALATDAWFPQVNGVVRSLSTTLEHLARRGIAVETITLQDFLTVPMPGYASIRLAIAPRFGTRRKLNDWQPDLVHIATEGPIGWAARGWCIANGVAYTSAFHTRFPEYASVRSGISAERFWPVMKKFHSASRAVLVSTQSLADELSGRGIGPTRLWSRGIDQSLFRPEGPSHPALKGLLGPVLLYVGRVAPEKNLDAFLNADVAGTKAIVGDGPALDNIKRRFPEVVCMGTLKGETLAAAYRSADCFVFPSLTDTFGLVVIEALASGVPVAGYPVTGPIDILGHNGRGPDGTLARPAGVLDDDLASAIRRALLLRSEDAAKLGAQFSWERATDQFIGVINEVLQNEHHCVAA